MTYTDMVGDTVLFSSRRRHTSFVCDWSSDVCSSDLIYLGALVAGLRAGLIYNTWPLIDGALLPDAARLLHAAPARSEERRVGKECRSRWSPYHLKKN